MSLEGRYLDRAQRIAEQIVVEGQREALADAIVVLLREFVHHDMEWAAVATEEAREHFVRTGHAEVAAALTELAASFRKRGCEP